LSRAPLIAIALWLAGCGDDRARIAASFFQCNPASPTADFDCGDGYMCYSAASALGGSFCAKRCDPKDPQSCKDGLCTLGGACLARCTVGAPDQCGGAGSPLLCAHRSNIASGDPLDGLCMPVSSLCTTSADCKSPIYDLCGAAPNAGQLVPPKSTGGLVCIQGGCVSAGVACAPGSSCVRKVLPEFFADIPDVCTPNCVVHSAATPDGGLLDECSPGLTCLSDVFPQTSERVCIPGYPGFLCRDTLGCAYGNCNGWEDVAPELAGLRTCDPSCASDDDCMQYDRPGNPVAFSKLTCRGGRCRTMQSMIFPELCLDPKEPCKLDPAATCRPPVELGGPPDGGVNCSAYALGSGKGTGGTPVSCVRTCQRDDECALLSQNSHVRHACILSLCLPVVPGITPCPSQAVCVAGLSCVQPANLIYPICTIHCAATADCAANPALGSAFACENGLCQPKTQSGCAPPDANDDQLCLSHQLQGGRCVSPPGWPCDSDDQCKNGSCHDGRCG
jgi:hypothetical protein